MSRKTATNRTAVKAYASRDTRRQLAKSRGSDTPVTVRFVCPVCGGAHSRDAH